MQNKNIFRDNFRHYGETFSVSLSVLSYELFYSFGLAKFLFNNRPFYRYGGHIEEIRLKEYYGIPRGHKQISHDRRIALVFFI